MKKVKSSYFSLKRLAALAACAGGMFIANPGQAQERMNVTNTVNEDFGSYDMNGDQRWDATEYQTRMQSSDIYRNWQANPNEFTQNDFDRGMYRRWDADGDGYLSADEYATGNQGWEADYGNNFEAWDTNADRMLDETEYMDGMANTSIYSDWDTDGDTYLSEEEFNNGLYTSWDTDRDNYLSADEYNNADYNSYNSDRKLDMEDQDDIMDDDPEDSMDD
jgi:hypothetical protein